MLTNEELLSDEVQNYFYNLLKKIGIQQSETTISAGVEKGKNIVSSIARVQVKEVGEEDKEYNFIIKSASRDLNFRGFIQSVTLFEREMFVYTKLFPEFEKLQLEKNVATPFQSYPKFYGFNSKETHEAIVMQDMIAIGYKMLDSKNVLDYNHAMLAMKEYGKLHALSYALRDQKPQVFMELSQNMEENYFSDKAWNTLKTPFRITLNRAIQTIDSVEYKTVYQKFQEFTKDLKKNFKMSLSSEEAGKYAVFGHGDCWVNNILFKYKDIENPNVPSQICLLDWQFSRLGSPALDLSYFLFMGTNKELRKKHLDEFIEEYHKSLCMFYSELTGSYQTTPIPYKILQEHLAKFSRYGLILSLQATYIMLNVPKEDINSKTESTSKRDMFTYESINMTKFNNHAKEIILDFDRLGYHFN